MTDKKRCYIAGPMRNHPNFNFDAFDQAKQEVEALGYHPISPADMDRIYEGWGKYPPEDWQPTAEEATHMILRDLDVIANQCDAIYLLEGWETSSGANAERAFIDFLQGFRRFEVLYQTEDAPIGYSEVPC